MKEWKGYGVEIFLVLLMIFIFFGMSWLLTL